jgi:L-alanine-DL-glutamate epimerase-like enolase superfamily enzyme
MRQRIRELGYLGWRNWWVEPAFWDIKGRAAGRPVYELFGGQPGRVRLYASTGEVKSPSARVEEVERRWEEGFRAVKLRVHSHSLVEDIAQVEAVVRAFEGRELVVGVDANQGWRVDVAAAAPLWTYDRALRFARACEELGVAWLEEPLAMDDFHGLARLRAHTSVAIAGGELHTGGWPELRTMIEAGCHDIYQPDCTMVGGIEGSVRVMQRCMAEGLRYTPHTWRNGLGMAANLQVVGACPRRDAEFLEYPLAAPGWVPAARDAMLAEPFRPVDGAWLELPTAPGLGVAIDRRALRRWGDRFYTGTKTRVAVQVLLDKGFRTARELGRVKAERVRHGE